MLNTPLEVWTTVPNFTGYEVSTFGNFRTYRPQNGVGKFLKEPRKVTPKPVQGKPYLRVSFRTDDGKAVYKKAHVLVLEAFVEPAPTPEHQTRHLNGNHRENYLSNLVWGTPQENADDRINHGTQLRGVSIHTSKLTEEDVREIRSGPKDRSKVKYFTNKFGVSRSCILDVLSGKTWSHVC